MEFSLGSTGVEGTKAGPRDEGHHQTRLHPPAPAYGWLHPAPGEQVDDALVTGLLAARGVLVAIEQADTAAGQSKEFVALTTADGHAVTMRPGGPLTRGPRLPDLAMSLAELSGLTVDLGDISFGPPEDGFLPQPPRAPTPYEPTAPCDVLLTRADPTELPLLARRVGCAVDVATLGAWSLVRPVERSAQLHRHRFTADDVPVVALSVVGGQRYVSVLTAPGHLPGVTLTRINQWHTWITAADVAHLEGEDLTVMTETLRWFADPQAAPDNDLELLREQGGFAAGIDVAKVGSALQSTDDEKWFARVLDALALPTTAADVHEGRTELTDAVRVEPGGLGVALAGALRRPLGRAGRPARHRS